MTSLGVQLIHEILARWLPRDHWPQFEDQREFSVGVSHSAQTALLGLSGLILTVGGIPLNNSAFARGLIHSGVKFPLISESHIQEIVAWAPSIQLRYPEHRHLALPRGVDRREVAGQIREWIKEVNARDFEFLRDQISELVRLMTSSSPAILVSQEELAFRFLKTQEGQAWWVSMLKHPGLNSAAGEAPYLWRVRDGYRRGEGVFDPHQVLAEIAERDVIPSQMMCMISLGLGLQAKMQMNLQQREHAVRIASALGVPDLLPGA